MLSLAGAVLDLHGCFDDGRGIPHANLNPSNILCFGEDGERRLAISGFGSLTGTDYDFYYTHRAPEASSQRERLKR